MVKAGQQSEAPTVQITADQLRALDSYDKHAGLRKLTYGVAIFSGLGTAVIKIYDQFYQSIKGSPFIKALKEDRNAVKDAIVADATRRAGTTNPMGPSELGSSLHRAERDFSKAVDTAILEKFGIESRGPIGKITGTWHRFRAMGPYSEAKLVFGTIFTTAIALSAFSLLNQRAEVRQNMADLKRQLDAQEAQQSRA